MNDLYNMSILNGFSEILVETKFGHLWKVPVYSDYFHKTSKIKYKKIHISGNYQRIFEIFFLFSF